MAENKLLIEVSHEVDGTTSIVGGGDEGGRA
jgi:hypothetical protein